MKQVFDTTAGRRLTRMAAMIAFALVLAACGTFGERHSGDRIAPSGVSVETRTPASGEVDLGGQISAGEEGEAFEDTEVYAGTGVFIDESAIRDRADPPGEDGEITLNFEGQGIQEVVHAILGHMFQENYVISPGVSGEVTFSTAKPLTRDQVMPVLEMLLRWNGATLIWREGQYQVIPIAEAVRGNLVPRSDAASNGIGYEVMVVPLEYIAQEKMAEILEPYAQEDGVFNTDSNRGLLFLAGTRFELRNYLQIIETFDVDWLSGMSIGMFSLSRIEVGDLLPELESIFGEGSESPLEGMFRFMPLERLNALMVITPSDHYLQEAEKWIRRLDRSSPEAGARLYVYRVKNLEADVLAGYLGDLFGTGGSSRSRQRDNRGSLAPGMEPATVSSVSEFQRSRSESSSGSSQQRPNTAGGMQLGEDGDVRITAVQETNSLLIQASPSQYDAILSAIERLDEEPLQVLVEAQVLIVDLTDQLQYGVSWFLANRGPDEGGPTVPDEFVTSRRQNQALLTDAGSLLNLTRRAVGRTFVAATIDALEAVSNVRTISSPSLMVRNNSEASINVGRQLPVQSTRFVGGGLNDGTGTIGNVQFINTGVILEVTPRVNPGGLVYLSIRQEVSSPGETGVGDNPSINTRTISTEVAIQSGQTIMLGGLIQEDENISRNGVPFLQRIPGLGNLFRSTGNSVSRTETLVLITPTVIETTDKLRAVSDEVRDRFRALQPLTPGRPM
ncbi:MAG: type II secretion system secretin GspD [Wenzhouxiangella sp.]|jgi:general secretion pathway protein D|nr:type II secretion system secretin GspD [Wenzhouxiangella sp.]